MRERVTAIFDIGKTNKKFFLFDRNLQPVHREEITLPSLEDEDGYPCENLPALAQWEKEVLRRTAEGGKYQIEALNFSAYGATLVHLDAKGDALPPVYDYTKPLPAFVLESFLENYGPVEDFALKTGAIPEGMLNSGLQLYWLKRYKPEFFGRIHTSLHLPQYLSYCFSGKKASDYTSVGCHTGLWDFGEKTYHSWVQQEGLESLLAPIMPSTATTTRVKLSGETIRLGVGIHDSSASLLPYLHGHPQPFLLVSTGTWSVCMNPNAFERPDPYLLENDGLYYLQPDGKPVAASRIFLGHTYERQITRLAYFYGAPTESHHSVGVDPELYRKILRQNTGRSYFQIPGNPEISSKQAFPFHSFEEAYHYLMVELVRWQCANIRFLAREQPVRHIFVDGGFAKNDHYTGLLAYLLPEMELQIADASMGSALGAALAISKTSVDANGLKSLFSLREPESLEID